MFASGSRSWWLKFLVAVALSLLITSEGSAQARKRRYSTWVPTNDKLSVDDAASGKDSKKKKKTDSETDATSLNSGKRVRTGDDVGLGTPITGAGTIPLTPGQTFTLGGGMPGSPGSARGMTPGGGPVQLTMPSAPINGASSMTPGIMGPPGGGGTSPGMPGAPPGGGSPSGPPGGMPGAPPGGGRPGGH